MLAALGAVAATALPARSQFQPVAMKLPAEWDPELARGRWPGSTATTGFDLGVIQFAGTAPGLIFPYRDLLGAYPSPYAHPATVLAGAIGSFDGFPTVPTPDVAWGANTGISVTWGADPTTYVAFPGIFSQWVTGMAPIRLLPRPQPVVIATAPRSDATALFLYGVDLLASRVPPSPPTARSWNLPGGFSLPQDGYFNHRILPLRLSPGAVAGDVDDAIVPLGQGFFLLWHNSTPPPDATLLDVDVTAAVFGASGGLALTKGGFLPPGAQPEASCLGAAALDVDGDGLRDVVFSYGNVMYPSIPGWLLWIKNRGTILETVQNQKPWNPSLVGRADLWPLVDSGTLRQLDLDFGESAFAVADRTLEQIIVVRGDGAGFTTLALPAPRVFVRDMVAMDVVGSSAKDLVVLVDLPPNNFPSEVWIYPDVGDAAPRISWNPQPPATALLGVDLPLSVDASDPDTPFTVTWVRPPVADVVGPTAVTVPGSELCNPTGVVDVTVRALDSLGVYQQVAAKVPLAMRPSLNLLGADPPGRLVLAPGGVTGRADGLAWPGCGSSPTFTWGQTALTGMVQTSAGTSGSSAWYEFAIPEAAYPEALSGAPALTLAASEGALSGIATLPLDLDARGLVEASATFDQAALAAGELGTARIRLASRIGVALPAVRAAVRLAGLAFAGPLQATGAPATTGAAAGELIIDPLPGMGGSVEIEVPVRSMGSPGSVSIELFSSGGFRVSPEAAPAAGRASLPGCGCGHDGAPALAFLFFAAAWRRRPRTVA
jgi:uncharacterized protein (TIGR03382 family)